MDVKTGEVDNDTIKMMREINKLDIANGNSPTYNLIDNGTELEEKKIFKEERLNGFRLAVRKYWTNYYSQMLLYTDKYDEILEGLKKTKLELEEVTNNSKFIKTDMLFITVNPDKTVDLSKFLKKVKSCVSKKWIDEHLYVIEQRGDNEETVGSGFHVHMLIYHQNKSKKWSDVKREIQSTFTSVCETSNPSCLKIKNVPSQTAYNNYLNYMIGKKKDVKNKLVKQEFDKVFRKNNGLLDVYTSSQDFFSNHIVTCENGSEKRKDSEERKGEEDDECVDEVIDESCEFNCVKES